MLKRRRITKQDIKHDHKVYNRPRKSLDCKVCGITVENVVADCSAITCWRCVAKMVAPPDLPAKPKPVEERRPRGWQFMNEYRAPDGTLYHRGVQVNEKPTTESTNSTERARKRKTDDSTTAEDNGNNSGHSKRTKSTKPRKSDTKPTRKSSGTGRKSPSKSTKRKDRGSSI